MLKLLDPRRVAPEQRPDFRYRSIRGRSHTAGMINAVSWWGVSARDYFRSEHRAVGFRPVLRRKHVKTS